MGKKQIRSESAMKVMSVKLSPCANEYWQIVSMYIDEVWVSWKWLHQQFTFMYFSGCKGFFLMCPDIPSIPSNGYGSEWDQKKTQNWQNFAKIA